MSIYSNSITIAKVKDGAPGSAGPTGPQGKSITRVVQSYLATSDYSTVTTETAGWTSTIQTISSTKQYLWNFEKVYSETDLISSTSPVIIGRYGKDGEQGPKGEDGAPGAAENGRIV